LRVLEVVLSEVLVFDIPSSPVIDCRFLEQFEEAWVAWWLELHQPKVQ
jgi:hypothetical protein